MFFEICKSFFKKYFIFSKIFPAAKNKMPKNFSTNFKNVVVFFMPLW